MNLNMVHNQDCIEFMKSLDDKSIDSIVTDPPYEIYMMGKKWDGSGIAFNLEVWQEALRILKPGGYLLAFGGTRTYHRMACAIEDAGFDIRNCLMWVFGQGFPKSMSIPKAIEATIKNGSSHTRSLKKVEQDGDGESYKLKGKNNGILGEDVVWDRKEFTPTTKEAQQWEGWKTDLKPNYEPIVMARKPLDGTYAQNVMKYGVGGINIDGCRIGETGTRNNGNKQGTVGSNSIGVYGKAIKQDYNMGRFPGNLMHDGSDEVVGMFPNIGTGANMSSASRFFYCAKTSKEDKEEGLEGVVEKKTNDGRKIDADNPFQRGSTLRQNTHPTVKPTSLMRYLCRMVTPPNGLVFDPFSGSGSTGKAAVLEGFRFVGSELSAEYAEIANRRIQHAMVTKDKPEKVKKSKKEKTQNTLDDSDSLEAIFSR